MNDKTAVTYDLAELLKRIEDKIDKNYEQLNQKIDSNQKETNEKFKEVNTKLENVNNKVNNIEVKLATIDTEVKKLNEDVRELKGSSKAQIWTLIGILVTAVSGFLVAVARFVFYPIS